MKNGYYLSAYIEIDPLGNIYEFSHRHDQNMALWKLKDGNVDLVHYWELERVTGKKQFQSGFFSVEHFYEILDILLKPYNLSNHDIEEIWGVPQINSNGRYYTNRKFPEATYHAMSHMASAIFSDMNIFRNNNILGFAVDGGSDIVLEKETFKNSPFIGIWSDASKNEIKTYTAYSPGFLWDCMRCYYDIREGTLMALASASTSETFLDFPDILVENNVTVDKSKYSEVRNMVKVIEDLTEEDIGVKFNSFDERFSVRDNKISMVMKVVQKMSERIMMRNIDKAVELYGIDTKDTYLAMSGGFALNCPCNTILMKKYGFKGFLSAPCVNDSGMSLGMGLYSFYNELGREFNFRLRNAYYGDEYDIDSFIKKGEFADFISSVEPFNPDQVAEDIIKNPIVWFHGRAEIGPRALGNRSILGDPRKQQAKDQLNRIKKRQWWRPVAPIVLYDAICDWFEEDFDSPYMLQAIQVKKEKLDQVPGIVHLDGSSRVQTLKEGEGSTLLEDVLKTFYKKTGIPMICNTSLNDKGEPIINTIEEAMNFALRKGIDIIYINGNRIVLKDHEKYENTDQYKRAINVNYRHLENNKRLLMEEYNPLGADIGTIIYYIYTKVDNVELLRNSIDIKRLKIRAKIFMNELSPFLISLLGPIYKKLESAVDGER